MLNLTEELRKLFDSYVQTLFFDTSFKFFKDGKIVLDDKVVKIKKKMETVENFEIYQFQSFGKIAGGSIVRNVFTDDFGVLYAVHVGNDTIYSFVGPTYIKEAVMPILLTDYAFTYNQTCLINDLTNLELFLLAFQIDIYKGVSCHSSTKASVLLKLSLCFIRNDKIYSLPDEINLYLNTLDLDKMKFMSKNFNDYVYNEFFRNKDFNCINNIGFNSGFIHFLKVLFNLYNGFGEFDNNGNYKPYSVDIFELFALYDFNSLMDLLKISFSERYKYLLS